MDIAEELIRREAASSTIAGLLYRRLARGATLKHFLARYSKGGTLIWERTCKKILAYRLRKAPSIVRNLIMERWYRYCKPTSVQAYAEAAKKIPLSKMSWAEICEIDSDEEKELLKEMSSLLDSKGKEDREPGVLLIPGGMKEAMPRWHKFLEKAAKFCKLKIRESLVTIDSVPFPGLFSEDKETWQNASEGARTNQKDKYAAYQAVNSIFSFFAKPIVLHENRVPGLGELWVLNKIAYEWHKESFGKEFNQDAWKLGAKGCNLRNPLIERVKSLILTGPALEASELLVSALDLLVFKYIERLYLAKGSKASSYIKAILKTISKDGSQTLATHTRATKVITVENVKEGKKTVKKERIKISQLKPWVTRADELWTPEEKTVGKQLNTVFGDLANLIDGKEDLGPCVNGQAGKFLMRYAWEVSDTFNSIAQTRKKKIRSAIITGRDKAKKSDKITPEEWSTAKEAVLADSKTRNVLTDFLMGFWPGMRSNAELELRFRAILRRRMEEAAGYWEALVIDWSIFDGGHYQPDSYCREVGLKRKNVPVPCKAEESSNGDPDEEDDEDQEEDSQGQGDPDDA